LEYNKETLIVKSDIKVLLLAGSEDLNLKVLYCLFPAFKNIHVVANKTGNILKYSRYKKRFVHLPWSSHAEGQEECVQKLKQYCEDNAIDLIMPGDIAASAFLYKHKNVFVNQKIFPVMADEVLDQIDNKWTFAERLTAEGLSTPTTMLINQPEIVDETNRGLIEEKIGFPLVVKPLYCEASHGVEKIDSFEMLREHILGDKPYSSLPLIIQKYVDGYDIDLSFIADEGEILSKAVQKWTEEDVLEFCRHEEIEELGEKIVKLFQYSGAGHFDMRIDHKTGKLYVIECNPRFWFTITGAMWQGLNFVEAAVNYSTNREYKKDGAIGYYMLPGERIRMIMKKPWYYFSLSKNQRKELWTLLLDPVPQFIKLVLKS